MSLKVMHLVFEADHVQDRSEFTLLLALADEADDEGKCFPGRERLARKSRLSERTTIRVTERLSKRDALAVIERGGPSEYGRPNLYLLNIDWLKDPSSTLADPVTVTGPDPDTVSPPAQCHPDTDDGHPDTVARKSSSVSPNPSTTATTSRSSMSDTAAREKAQHLLEERLVDRPVAERLATRFPRRIPGLCARYDAERQAGHTRTPGWLVKAVEEGWSEQASVVGERLLTRAEALDHNNKFGGPTGKPWDELFERVETPDGVRWRVL